MFDISTFISFIGVSILLMLAPGPDIIFTLTQGLTKGKKAGVTVALGLACGNFVHTIGVALGLSVIFETSEYAFWIVKILGAGYLAYLAYMSFVHRHEGITKNSDKSTRQDDNLFRKGFIMNVLNPKVAIFFLALLPRFVSLERGMVPLQFLILGAAFVVMVAIVFGSVGYFAGYFGAVLNRNPRYALIMNVISSIVFLGIAISLLLF